ncbi:putative F-box domain, galactose oxidase/kelch, beta-propeller, F-box associated interaction [Helianthus annuus]|nr:putative F-box domain, galactose oxidase/kelch, beta-propeller, F-box associated interaction [Helianthus annuus]
MAAELPSEIMFDILSRMPVKSLARFRCVSKLWCNYINNPYLEIMCAKRAIVNEPMLIMFHQFPSDHPSSPCMLSYLEYTAEEEEETFTLQVNTKPPVMEFMCKSATYRYPNDIVLGSCNGLLYSSKGHCDDNTLFVIHPLRKECYELPPINIRNSYLRISVDETCGLGFDYSNNTFKMVSVVLREHVSGPNFYQVNEGIYTMVHVLGTDSWRRIPQVPSYPITGEGVFANGCLHWLISNERYGDHSTYLERRVVSFDVSNEKFGLINAPHGRPCGLVREQLVDLHGEVGYVYHIVNHGVEVWVLKERGWVMHCEFDQKWPLPRGVIKVLGFWNQNGDVLMTDKWKEIYVYNLESDSLDQAYFVGWEEKAAIDIRLYEISLFTARNWINNYSEKKVS